ncbi:Potassium channel subfamily K member 1 [Sarcoptes scabiei]|uniref:Potassium channel subfamily K member 1 n=1 Tax=Sarcoptes scabiei TaxID=52283 RepID=A0A834RG25_SARSC|nr:Potassium channel subfamily K member 1 [Sarcoptes scabiei]
MDYGKQSGTVPLNFQLNRDETDRYWCRNFSSNPVVSNGSSYQNYHHHQHHQPNRPPETVNDYQMNYDYQKKFETKTLYQNRSVSILNVEYKLKEKYPHLAVLIFFFIIYITMILMGASLFMAFEAEAEQRLRDQILSKQQSFIDKNQCVNPNELKHFIKSIIITYDKGVNLALLNDIVDLIREEDQKRTKRSINDLNRFSNRSKRNNSDEKISKNLSQTIVIENNIIDEQSDQVIEEIIVHKNGPIIEPSRLIVPNQMSNWEFGSSMTYVASVVTTIGYGHITPITNAGKLLTIIFGAIAIPFTLLFLSILISMIRDGPIKQIEVWLIRFFGLFTTEITLLKIRFLHLFIVTIVLCSILIILPAFLFERMEPDWSMLDSIYYCFATITTIGLGDYVPGQNGLIENRTWYLISIVIYMYTGLCLMMLWIALVLRIPYFNFKTFLVIEEPELLEKKLITKSNGRLINDPETLPLLDPASAILTNHSSQPMQTQSSSRTLLSYESFR